MPGPAPSEYSPFIKFGMPQANSTTSRPRWTSPLASAKVLPCSEDNRRARSSYSPWISSKNLNMTRARRCGLVAAQAGNAASALAMAFSTSDILASATLACTSPVLGLNTSPCRPEAPFTSVPPMKWPMSRMDGLPGNERRWAVWICTYCAGFFRDGHGGRLANQRPSRFDRHQHDALAERRKNEAMAFVKANGGFVDGMSHYAADTGDLGCRQTSPQRIRQQG